MMVVSPSKIVNIILNIAWGIFSSKPDEKNRQETGITDRRKVTEETTELRFRARGWGRVSFGNMKGRTSSQHVLDIEA